MKLSKQSAEVITEIGSSIGGMFHAKLSSLQILLIVEIRFREGKRKKGEYVFAHEVRKNVEELMHSPPSRQGFWVAINALKKQKLIYLAPPAKGTWKRAISLTQKGADLLTYPKSIHPFQKTT